MSKEWKPIKRVGTPRLHAAREDDSQVDMRLRTAPAADQAWRDYFEQFTKSNGVPAFYDSFGTEEDGIYSRIHRDTIERVVAQIDQGIENANQLYERIELPLIAAAAERKAQEKAARAVREQDLQERAARLAAPDIEI